MHEESVHHIQRLVFVHALPSPDHDVAPPPLLVRTNPATTIDNATGCIGLTVSRKSETNVTFATVPVKSGATLHVVVTLLNQTEWAAVRVCICHHRVVCHYHPVQIVCVVLAERYNSSMSRRDMQLSPLVIGHRFTFFFSTIPCTFNCVCFRMGTLAERIHRLIATVSAVNATQMTAIDPSMLCAATTSTNVVGCHDHSRSEQEKN